MSQLRQQSGKLNAVSDEASTVLRRLEQLLGELGLEGEPFRTDTECYLGATTRISKQLGYGRDDTGKYILYIATRIKHPGEVRHELVITPWQGCDRTDKIEAAGAIPGLLQRLLEQAERFAPTTLQLLAVLDGEENACTPKES